MKLRQFDILFIVVILLFVTSLVFIFFVPPGGKTNAKKAENIDLKLVPDEPGIIIDQAGGEPKLMLDYYTRPAPLKTDDKGNHFGGEQYRIQLTQQSEHTKGNELHKVESHIEATWLLGTSPENDAIDRLIFSDFHISVTDDGNPVALNSMDSLMNGIPLQTQLQPAYGLGRVVPYVAINPQIGRILYFLCDAVRDAYVAFPKNPVGPNGQWHYTQTDNESHEIRSTGVTLTQITDGGVGPNASLQFVKNVQLKRNNVEFGTSKTEITLRGHQLEKATGAIQYEGGSVNYQITRRW